jgi:hypothetical protein
VLLVKCVIEAHPFRDFIRTGNSRTERSCPTPGCGVALVADDEVGVDAVCVKGVGALEDAAVRRAIATRKLAMRMRPR